MTTSFAVGLDLHASAFGNFFRRRYFFVRIVNVVLITTLLAHHASLESWYATYHRQTIVVLQAQFTDTSMFRGDVVASDDLTSSHDHYMNMCRQFQLYSEHLL